MGPAGPPGPVAPGQGTEAPSSCGLHFWKPSEAGSWGRGHSRPDSGAGGRPSPPWDMASEPPSPTVAISTPIYSIGETFLKSGLPR